MKRSIWTTAMFCAFLMAGCERVPQLEVRTFALEHVNGNEAGILIDPYVYGGRPGAPGASSMVDGAITVRETPDNLDQIARVLAEYDKARSDVRLHFQLIEADGFTESDPRIADVEEELRRIFQFGGYRLAGEALVSATDHSEVQQAMQGPDGRYLIAVAEVVWLSPGLIRLEGVELGSSNLGLLLRTTVNIRPGQTLVLGSSPREGSTATLLLTVRAEEAPGPA